MGSAEDTVQAYMKAFEAGDATAVAGLFSDDGAVLAPPMPTIRGRSEIEAAMVAVFGAISVRVEEMAVDRVREAGDSAFVEMHSREAITNRSDGSIDVHQYRELFCLERDGRDWKIVSYMFNASPDGD